MSETRYFKVLGSSHQEGDVNYEKGKVVETTRDLVAMFGRNKFRPCNKKGKPIDDDEELDEAEDLEKEAEEGDLAANKKGKKTAGNKNKDPDSTHSESPEGVSEDSGESKTAYEPVKSSLGDDVTEEFGPKVVEADLAVVKKGKNFFIVDRDIPDQSLNGDEELHSKKAVEAALAKKLAK